MEKSKKPRSKKTSSSRAARSIASAAAPPAAPEAPLCVVVPEATVSVDYPGPGEILISGSYTIRIGAIGAARTEISIDGGPWLACRQAVGYWWHDWAGYGSGFHRVQARITTSDGRILTTEPRVFTVRLAAAAV